MARPLIGSADEAATSPASKAERVAAVLLLLASFIYLLQFVRRGWVPHDEGLLGQAAERVLRGDLPHVDYQEPYTGALAWVYAALFKITGIDLVNIRWLLYGGAVFATGVAYAIFRRYLKPVAAAVATWLAMAWSFPNYFAGLPSWWLLICALVELWALFRYVETDRSGYLALAGLSVGLAFVFKQTGVYLFPPLLMAIMADRRLTLSSRAGTGQDGLLRFLVALSMLGFATVMLRSGLRAAEILYLLVPVAASCAAFVILQRTTQAAAGVTPWREILIATAAAALPCAVLLVPYAAHGALGQFVNGAFIVPQMRLTVTSLPMLPAGLLVFGVWIIVCMLPAPVSFTVSETRVLGIARWALVVLLTVLSFSNLWAYHSIWQSSRSVSALLPAAALWLLATGRVNDVRERRRLFIAASLLAWASLIQFPFAAPVYFCYVAPLGVIAAVAVLTGGGWIRRPGIAPWAALLLLFAVLSLHRGDVTVAGLRHEPRTFDTALALDRAHLYVSSSDASKYRRIVSLVAEHVREGGLLAGPDCPEVYFLTGHVSPSGALYDFFSQGDSGQSTFHESRRSGADVIVINHSPIFSTDLAPVVITELRRDFPQSERIGEFEIRWK